MRIMKGGGGLKIKAPGSPIDLLPHSLLFDYILSFTTQLSSPLFTHSSYLIWFGYVRFLLDRNTNTSGIHRVRSSWVSTCMRSRGYKRWRGEYPYSVFLILCFISLNMYMYMYVGDVCPILEVKVISLSILSYPGRSRWCVGNIFPWWCRSNFGFE